MGENYAICLMAAMDRLWFHQIVLSSEPTSLFLPPQSAKKSQPISESFNTHQSSITSIPEDEEVFSVSSVITLTPTPQDDSDSDKETRQRRRSTDSISSSRCGSHSSLTWAQNSSLISPQSRKAKLKYSSGSLIRLEKSMSCKSLSELEVEEVKGFMDLGFEFSQSQLSPRMMSVLPGLQRLGGCLENDEKDGVKAANEAEKDDEIEEENVEKRSSVVRPYLSEAWLIKRPDSPLLNLRVPRAYAADDMKKHLKYWARIVASVIQQES